VRTFALASVCERTDQISRVNNSRECEMGCAVAVSSIPGAFSAWINPMHAKKPLLYSYYYIGEPLAIAQCYAEGARYCYGKSSVCPFVCLSVMLRYRDHVRWNTSTISQLVSMGVRSLRKPMPTNWNYQITVEEFQRMWSRYLNITERQTNGQTDDLP